MGLRDRPHRAPKEPQGILPFEFETTGEPEDVTARAGLSLVAETVRSGEEERERLGIGPGLWLGELVADTDELRSQPGGR